MFIKNKVFFKISLISFSIIILGACTSPWSQLDESLTKNRVLNEVQVVPIFWAWPEAYQKIVMNSFGEFFVTETHWGYDDPNVPLTLDVDQIEQLQDLLQSVRIRSTRRMVSFDNLPESSLFSISFSFVNPERQNTENPNHTQLTFYGSGRLEIRARVGKEGSFEIHRHDETIFYDILEVLMSEALEITYKNLA